MELPNVKLASVKSVLDLSSCRSITVETLYQEKIIYFF